MNLKVLFASLLCFSAYLLVTESGPSFPFEAVPNPMERREEKLREFREKRDHFFREDSRSPLTEADRRSFTRLSYFPIDLKYAMVGTIELYPIDPKPLYVSLRTNKGTERRYIKYGRFKFKLEGREHVLQIYRVLGGDELFLPFKDRTAETETYSRGRYLFIEPMPEGKVLIDFNRAHNPFCAYHEKYTCPDPSLENSLNIRIQAGEKRFR